MGMTETSPTTHEEFVDDIFAFYNGDYSKREVFAESVTFVDPLAELHGRDELEEFIREMRTTFPDLELTWTDMLAGDDTIMVEWKVRATHKGDLKGIPPTGNQVEHYGMEKYLISNNKVQEVHIYFDAQELPEQLGLTFPAVIGQLPKLAWGKFRSLF